MLGDWPIGFLPPFTLERYSECAVKLEMSSSIAQCTPQWRRSDIWSEICPLHVTVDLAAKQSSE